MLSVTNSLMLLELVLHVKMDYSSNTLIKKYCIAFVLDCKENDTFKIVVSSKWLMKVIATCFSFFSL